MRAVSTHDRNRVANLGKDLGPIWQCHGFQAQGGVAGPKLAPHPMAIEAFTAFVRSSNRAMPPYQEAVPSNEDLADIYANLQSIPKPPDYKNIPLLNQ